MASGGAASLQKAEVLGLSFPARQRVEPPTRPPAAANGWGAFSPRGGAASRAGKKELAGRGAERPWQVQRARPGAGETRAGVVGPTGGARPCCNLSLPTAPEPLSPAGGAGEEAPDEDEDEAEAEDPERRAGASGARSCGGGGSGGSLSGSGAGTGGCGGPGGALTRRAVTLRVLLKDAQLEPGAGVLSIYYLVSAPHPPSHPSWDKEGTTRSRAPLQQAERGSGEGRLRHGASRPSTNPSGREDFVHQTPHSTKEKLRLREDTTAFLAV